MPLNLTGTITGAAITGLTTPSYTLTVDSAPTNPRGKKSVVTTIGGTQTGVTSHSISRPFFVTFTPPNVLKGLPSVNPITGLANGPIPKNEYRFNFHSGATPLAGLSPEMIFAEVRLRIPAGVETNDRPTIRALVSFMIGVIDANAEYIANTLLTTGVS
jgi:hypothetical protein